MADWLTGMGLSQAGQKPGLRSG